MEAKGVADAKQRGEFKETAGHAVGELLEEAFGVLFDEVLFAFCHSGAC